MHLSVKYCSTSTSGYIGGVYHSVKSICASGKQSSMENVAVFIPNGSAVGLELSAPVTPKYGKAGIKLCPVGELMPCESSSGTV